MGCRKLLLIVCLYFIYASAQNGPIGSDITDNKSGQQNQDVDDFRQNRKPMFEDCGKYAPEVEEQKPRGTFVIQVHAVDKDPPNKEGGRITYTIEQEGGVGQSDFRIESDTGKIFTDREFDRDEPTRTKEVYLTVRATDDGRPALADICTFKVTVTDINDNQPLFDQQEYSIEVAEDLPVNTSVLRVFAYDIDAGENARLTYEFSKTSSSPDFNEYFSIDPNNGFVRLMKNLAGKHGYRFKSVVRVHDNGQDQKFAEAEVSFTVVDSNKKPPHISVVNGDNFEFEENINDFQKPLIRLKADSGIEDKSVAFELVKGKTAQTNKDQTFLLTPDDDTAVITLGRPLDYETVTEYQLTVRVKNKDSLYSSITIPIKVLDVNDEIPTFIELLNGSIVENNEIGVQAMTVRAIDKDGTSPNNEIIYELINHRDKFAIDQTTGVITGLVRFDREKEKIYHVTVNASDKAPSALHDRTKPNSAEQTFQISIEDQNDNPPKFKKSLYIAKNIPETSDINKNVIEVKAEDIDTASLISYSIIEGNIDDAFWIEENTGMINVKNKLDFEKIENYSLTVEAYDGIYKDTAKVDIRILNENDEFPKFEKNKINVEFEEENVSDHWSCLVKLKAYDPDIKNQTVDQKIVYRVDGTYTSWLSVDNDGCVTVIKPLDRDPPNGAPSYQAYISAHDNNGNGLSLKTYAEINITLIDVNDNAPYLNITEVVWQENQGPGKITTLTAIDRDGPENGPPFTFKLKEPSDKFSIQGSVLSAIHTFDREKHKYYDVPIEITDNGSPTMMGVSILRVIIGDVNDNPAKDGSSEIFVYKYEGFEADIEIGRVYVDDPDDWDLPDKVFILDSPSDGNFKLHPHGMIAMTREARPGQYSLDFTVDEKFNGNNNRVNAYVSITIKEIPKEAVQKSGSIRINRTTPEEFLKKDPESRMSKKDKLQNNIAKMFNISFENVDVFTVLVSPYSNGSTVDVRFSAHGSPYYAPEKLNYKAAEYQEKLQQDLDINIVMVDINECFQNHNCSDESCTNILNIKNDPAVVFTNKTSFVGVKAISEAKCECITRTVTECFNGGTPTGDGHCDCPEGSEGPNCENLGISFQGDGWAIYPTFDSCTTLNISLHILSQADNGLIFYAGPLTSQQANVSKDFISLELKDGSVVFKIDVGSSVDEVVFDKKINDGAMHKIKIRINYTSPDVALEVDECGSGCLQWKSLTKGLLQLKDPLQIGGRSNIFSDEAGKSLWDKPPSSQGFRGCITNFTYNSYVYNLGAPSYKHNAFEGVCNFATFQAATFGIDSNFLVAILVCLAILLILLLAVVVHKRKQDNLNEKDIDDTRENIINYEDEGGGECDTNFDLSVFPSVDEKPLIRDNLYKPTSAEVPADIGSFLDDKKRACDKDTLPYDDVRHYAYEGDGNSSASSLSSLASCTDEGDLKFNYLSSFGPRFRKLADMYGDDGSEEGSQI